MTALFTCQRKHALDSAEERDRCDAQMYDAVSVLKLAQVGFSGPAKVRRIYMPGRLERRGDLKIVVFSEEQIIPWEIEDEEE